MEHISPADKRARYYTEENGRYVCGLCPHGCRIGVGQFGRCGSRYGEEDHLRACTYGMVSGAAVDPMEKKPFYHFHPGETVFSVGGVGCNMSCRYCQNHFIAQSDRAFDSAEYVSPEDLIAAFRESGEEFFSFTYNEPAIWLEYMLDVAELAPDLKMVIVTNGLINEEPLKDLCRVAQAFNMDIKGFSSEFYRKICGGSLEDTLRSIRTVYESGRHLEITYLLIPGYNDSAEEIGNMADWVVGNLSPDVPVHFTRFHPDNEMTDVPWTPEDTMYRAKRTALERGLNFVYLGNLAVEEDNTVCPSCGTVVVRRSGRSIRVSGADGGRCPRCGRDLGIIL